MFAVDLRAVRAPQGLDRRLQPAPQALRTSVLSITQRPYPTVRNKKDRGFAPKKPPSPHAQTERRSTHFPSAPCALFSRSSSQERKSSLSFSRACARFWRNGGYPAHRKINGSYSMICKLKKVRTTERASTTRVRPVLAAHADNIPIRAAAPQPNAQPRMRQPHLCVIVFGRPPVSARRVSRIIKTQSEVHSL